MNNDQFTYVEVVRRVDGNVIHRVYVQSGRTDRVEDGMNINLNHDDYYTQVAYYESAQELNPTK